jgi:hypothetical protein
VAVSNRTISLLAEAFFAGTGPPHSSITMIWTLNGAVDYLRPEAEANKRDRVLYGLRWLRDGRPSEDHGWTPDRPPNQEKLHAVVGELAAALVAADATDEDALANALRADGLILDGDGLVEARPMDQPADELSGELARLFAERAELAVARNHYEQAERAFDRGDWESANAQFRSSFDATYDVLAHANGCPADRTGGAARRWLQENGVIEPDEAELMKAFGVFAGRAGSHAGLSDAVEAGLRRHFAAALIAFGVAKIG